VSVVTSDALAELIAAESDCANDNALPPEKVMFVGVLPPETDTVPDIAATHFV
jgi:hypothetical protein